MRWLVCLVLLMLPALAHADDREARAVQSFRRGAAAYAKGEFVAAAQAFEEANTILPAGAALYNAGLAWDGAHEDLKAAVDFASALDMGLVSAAQLEDARKRLADLDTRLAAIDVKAVGAHLEVDGAATEPGHVRLMPGEHRIRATFEDGRSSEMTVSVKVGATTPLELVAPPKEAPPPPPAPKKESSNAPRIAGIVLGGAALAGVGVGVALGLTGVGARDDFVNNGRTDTGLRDKAVALQTAANITFIASAIVGAAGIGLLTWSFVRKPSVESSVRLGPGGVLVSGTF
jgi:hypothetical protein